MKFVLGFGGSGTGSTFSGAGGASWGFKGRVKSLEMFADFRGGIGGASWSCVTMFRNTGLSLDDTSMSGTLLMLVKDDEADELPEDVLELPDDDELTLGGAFDDFPLTAGFVDDPLASFSCDNDLMNGTGVLRFSIGDICGL